MKKSLPPKCIFVSLALVLAILLATDSCAATIRPLLGERGTIDPAEPSRSHSAHLFRRALTKAMKIRREKEAMENDVKEGEYNRTRTVNHGPIPSDGLSPITSSFLELDALSGNTRYLLYLISKYSAK
jgi:hypothetical protein